MVFRFLVIDIRSCLGVGFSTSKLWLYLFSGCVILYVECNGFFEFGCDCFCIVFTLNCLQQELLMG